VHATAETPVARSDAAVADGEARTLRVDVAKLDACSTHGRDRHRPRARGAAARGAAVAGRRPILEAHREADRLQLELQEQVMKARMVPVGRSSAIRPRGARSRACARQGRAPGDRGDDVEVDTRVVQRLRDP